MTFQAGTAHFIKFYTPTRDYSLIREIYGLAKVQNKLNVSTPDLLERAQLERWPYLIFRRVPGIPLPKVWSVLDTPQKQRILEQLGQTIGLLHQIPIADAPQALCLQPAEWAAGKNHLAEMLSYFSADPDAQQDLLAAIESGLMRLALAYHPVLLHFNLSANHLLLTQHHHAWYLSGVLDFDGMMVGHHEADFIMPIIGLQHEWPFLLQSLFRGYGCTATEQDEAWAWRLLTLVLLDTRFQSDALWRLWQQSSTRSWQGLMRTLLPFI